MKPITKEYFRKFSVLLLITIATLMFFYRSLNDYSPYLLVLALLVYLFGSKTKIPKDAAYYGMILLLDIIIFAYWTGIMLFFFFLVIIENDPIFSISFFLFFSVFPLFLMRYSVKLSSRWYLFTEDTFQWSGTEGIHSVKLSDIELAEPYVKKKYPFAPTEMGMMITLKSGKKIRLMSNNLSADEVFMKHLRELYLAYDDTFSQYLKDGIYPEEDEIFNDNLKKLQREMKER